MKRTLSLVLIVLILSCSIPFTARAASVHIVDDIGLLTAEENAAVEARLSEVSDQIGIDVLVRASLSLNGREAWNYAQDSMDVNYGGVTNGVLFLFSQEEYVWSYAAKGSGSVVFTDEAIDAIAKEFLSDLNAKEYAAAFIKYADAVLSYYQDTMSVSGFSGNYLIDGAALLSEEEAESVEEKLADASESIGMKVLLRTTYSLGGKYTMQFADDAMDYEYGDVEDGILFLISMEDRDWYVSTKGRGIEVFTDDVIDSIVDSFLSKISSGDYAEGFEGYANATVKYYKRATSVFHFDLISIGVPLVVALIIAFIVVSMLKAQLKTARFHNAGYYLKEGSFVLTQKMDLFLYTTVTKTRIQSESSGGSHTSSSGSSHGGHGGKF